MIKDLSSLVVISAPDDSIDVTIRKMSESSRHVSYAGLAVILNQDYKLLGILTDGDLRRAYASGINFACPVSEIMVREPVTLPNTIPRDEILSAVYRLVRKSSKHNSEWIRHILLIDEEGRLNDVLDFFDLLHTQGGGQQKVAVFGMGYVGITLAVSLASRGHQVTGLDVLPGIIAQLAKGYSHVYEPGLREMLNATLARKQITFDTGIGSHRHDVYIIAVGTPLDSQSKPDLIALNNVLRDVGPIIKRNDLVMLRSTVPVGTTRKVVIPMLEALSGLRAGEHFHVAFSPERTLEGRSMQELRSLPQVVGGYTPICLRRATQFWTTLTPTVVQVTSLEASELVKLANNTFRDLSFAFANELAMLADSSNVNAFDLIYAANEGYPRNPIPFPSPGVGGYCLTKDPLLFGCTPEGPILEIILGRAGREVNQRAGFYPVTMLRRFAERYQKPLSSLSVLIVGAAFKGEPETSDLRGSVSLDIARVLADEVASLQVWDAVIGPEELRSYGLQSVTKLDETIKAVDAVLILNNHRLNVASEAYLQPRGICMVFDGWYQLDAAEIEKVPGITYATMGYMTPP